MTRNKTFAAWLALLAGWTGASSLYLRGRTALPVALTLTSLSALGCYGGWRLRQFGVDDVLAAWLAPLAGVSLGWGALHAILIGLTPCHRWNQRHNPGLRADAAAGASHGLTVVAVVLALGGGVTAALSALVFALQRIIELQTPGF